MEEHKKRFIIWIVVGVVVALVVVVLAFMNGGADSAKKLVENVTQTEEKLPGLENVAPVPNVAEIPQASTVAREQLPEGTIELSVSSAGFSPKEFSVSKGQKVTLAITSTDKSHTFAFKDQALNSVTLNAPAGKTSAVNFIAPTKPGEYAFRCDLPGHEDGGEVGVMIVK